MLGDVGKVAGPLSDGEEEEEMGSSAIFLGVAPVEDVPTNSNSDDSLEPFLPALAVATGVAAAGLVLEEAEDGGRGTGGAGGEDTV